MSGHSKWAGIKHHKALVDQKRSNLFTKLANDITIAARHGGGDINFNPTLRTSVEKARQGNMPKDNIENAIKKAIAKDAETLVEVVYEGKGPHGVLVYVACTTDNVTRTVSNVRSYFNKAGGTFVQAGSLEFLFSRKAVFEIEKKETINIDELEFELIDAGLENIELNDDTIYLYANYTDFGNMINALEVKGIEPLKSILKRIPNTPTVFSEEELVDIEKMLDRIEDDDDVQAVYTNID